MTKEEYIEKYFPDPPKAKIDNYQFLADMQKNFEVLPKSTYKEFQNSVTEMYNLFRDISKEVKGHSYLKSTLWKVFYAAYIVPERTKLFPEIQGLIEQRREKRSVNN